MGNLNYAVWAFAAGALIPVLAVCNGALARLTGNPVLSVAILFAIGLTCSTGALMFAGVEGWQAVRQAPLWMFCGGVIVAFYVLSVSVLAPRFGVGNTILFAVAAQIVTSTLIDHFGLFGAAHRPLSGLRMAGVAILLGGLILTQLSARSPAT